MGFKKHEDTKFGRYGMVGEILEELREKHEYDQIYEILKRMNKICIYGKYKDNLV